MLTALLRRWLRPTILDADGVRTSDRPVCYVLAQRSALDRAVLANACESESLPSPLTVLDQNEMPTLAHLKAPEGNWLLRRASSRRRSPELGNLVDAARAGQDHLVVPVSVFWGRAPQREQSAFRMMFSERWSTAGSLRRLIGLLFNRTHIFVCYGVPISVSAVVANTRVRGTEERRLIRLSRTQLRRQRESLIGPDLSHRRLLVNRVLTAPRVTAMMKQTAAETGLTRARVWNNARKNAEEIASDLSFTAIKFWDVVLTWLWNRLYDGVDVNGIDTVKEVARTHTVIYVPSHRSHMDYLLMSYVLFYNGLMLPHVAAGKNLNLPVVGTLLRKAGAFFMRRSFRDDPLYATIFEEYLDQVFDAGFSVEYYTEGGRSRTGRLLPPKPGMIAMTVRSFLRGASRPFAFIPVYFGYERVVESRSYMGELRGQAKQAESLSGLARSSRFLRQSFGRVAVNFGEPLPLTEFLDAHAPQWDTKREEALDGGSDWFIPTVNRLGEELHERINGAAAINPTGVLATALLATDRQAQDEPALARQIDLLLEIARTAPVSAQASQTPASGQEVIAICEGSRVVLREAHPLGDIIYLDATQSIALTWYRNNIAHQYALPSLLAALLASGRTWTSRAIARAVRTVYPYLRRELFLPFADADLEVQIERLIDILEQRGLIHARGRGFTAEPADAQQTAMLHQLAAIAMPTLERFYIAIALLDRHATTSGTGRVELVSGCVLTAQRCARLYRLDAPEFFDERLFSEFIAELVQQGVARCDEEDRVHPAIDLHGILDTARRVLDPAFVQGVGVTRELPELEAEISPEPGRDPPTHPA